MNAALAQDAFRPNAYLILSWIPVRRGDLKAAESAARRGLEIQPTMVSMHYYLGVILLERGERDAALAEMQSETIEGGQLGALARAYLALGRKSESDAALAKIMRTQSKGAACGIAEVYASRGDRERAPEWLERAYAQKDAMLVYIKRDPSLKHLEGGPRYTAFLHKMNLPE